MLAALPSAATPSIVVFVILFLCSAAAVAKARGEVDQQKDILNRLLGTHAPHIFSGGSTIEDAYRLDKRISLDRTMGGVGSQLRVAYWCTIAAGLVLVFHAAAMVFCANGCVPSGARWLLCSKETRGAEPTAMPGSTSTPTPTVTDRRTATIPESTVTPAASTTPTPQAICEATIFKWGHVRLRSWPADPVVEVYQPEFPTK